MQCARVFFTPTWIACTHRLILMLFLKRWMRPEGGASPRCFCCSQNLERRSTNPASVCWASQKRRQPGKKGSTHAERLQTQANCVLTNRLDFPAGCSCGLCCQRASLLPFICAIISRQQASVAGGVELTWQIYIKDLSGWETCERISRLLNRTNTLFAFIGLPVCAKQMRVSVCALPKYDWGCANLHCTSTVVIENKYYKQKKEKKVAISD